ncbi:hypothetical protein CU097_011519 [Rhizopus azygosporus]|uniref:PROP1-like PPR domain-containing protein n=1 Tax=Rhizopus azygosporus TaxID=86630 RepID=A0A367JJR1_RHIAZ|nr:hypothetical protein CU097_011519 [Rhizopus azygosporus]
MRKSMTHLKDVSRLISTPEHNNGTCRRRNSHLQTLLQAFQPRPNELFTLPKFCTSCRRRSALIRMYRTLSTPIDTVEPRKPLQPLMRFPKSLSIFNLTDRITLSDLDLTIRTRQADKAWSLFITLSRRGDIIPLTMCCSLYALLTFAKSMVSRGPIIDLRQRQMDQLLDYVQKHHHHTPELFLPSVEPIPIPIRKQIAKYIQLEETEKAWALFFKTVQEGKERLSRNLCIKLIMLMLKDKSLYKNQRKFRINLIASHASCKNEPEDRHLLPSDMLRIANICYRYYRYRYSAAHRLIDEFVENIPKIKQKNRADALEELIWRILSNHDLSKAQEVLDVVREKYADKVDISEMVYVNLMNAYGQQKKFHQALKLFEQFLESNRQPSVKGFNAILHVFASQGEASRASYVYSAMLKLNVEPDSATYTEMIRAHAHTTDHSKCTFFYNKMLQRHLTPNVYTYSALMHASTKRHDIHGVLRWFQIMLYNGVEPNEVSLSLVLKSLSQQPNQNIPDAMHWITREATMVGIKPDATLYTILLKMHAKRLGLESALKIHKEMIANSIEPNTYTYTTLIDACADNDMPETAQQIFELMKNSERHKPNTATYTALITAWARSSKLQQANAIILDFLKACKSDKSGQLWIDEKIKERLSWCAFCL